VLSKDLGQSLYSYRLLVFAWKILTEAETNSSDVQMMILNWKNTIRAMRRLKNLPNLLPIRRQISISVGTDGRFVTERGSQWWIQWDQSGNGPI
jgi:hypothetical protein